MRYVKLGFAATWSDHKYEATVDGEQRFLSATEAQALFNQCKTEGMFIYPLLSPTGVWAASHLKGGCQEITKWKAGK